jgi:hypothetical protein
MIITIRDGGTGVAGCWNLDMESRAGQMQRAGGSAPGHGRDLVNTSVPGRVDPGSMEEDIACALVAVSGEQSFSRVVQEAIGRALVRRGVATADLQTPPAHLYAAAVEALRLGSAADEIVNVVAACMDARSGHRVLPSYIDILRQVSRDELELLRNLPTLGRSTAVAHVNVILPTKQAAVVYRNVLPETLAAVCKFKDNIPQYVDNLARLGLLAIHLDAKARTSVYRTMANFSFVSAFLTQAPEGSRLAMSPSTIAITDLGEGLCRACFD